MGSCHIDCINKRSWNRGRDRGRRGREVGAKKNEAYQEKEVELKYNNNKNKKLSIIKSS